MEIAVGTVIDDRYEVLGRIGTGAVAVVYLARHLQLGSYVAIKVLLLPTHAVQARLLNEGRLQNALRDKHVVAVFDLVDVAGSPALVMEYVRGPSLQRLLEHVHFDLPQARAIGAGVLLGVRAAHQIGLVHRDLKPANVLVEVTDSGLVPKIADFGLAKLLQPESDGGATSTRTGSTLGSPAYMAPEQIRDARQVDERADVFSVGAVLYEVLTGRRAFGGEDVLDVYDRIREGRYPPVRSLAPEVPPELEAVVDGALAVDRERRIPSVGELLDRWTGGRGEAEADYPWPAATLALAAGLAPDRGGVSAASHSGATFDFDPAPATAEAASVDWLPTRDGPPQTRRGRRWRRFPIYPALVALGLGGSVLGCVGGAGLVGVGLATGYIEWGPRMAVPMDRIRAAYTTTELPHVSADPAAQERVRVAWEALRDGRPEVAAPALEAALEAEDTRADAGVHLLLATALLWTGDARAYDQIEAAAGIAERRKGPVADLARIAVAIARGTPDAGRVAAHRASWPDDLLTMLLVGSLDGWDHEQRQELLRAAMDADPERVGARVELARLQLERGRVAEAAKLVAAGLVIAPAHPRLLAADATLALRDGDAARARGVAERATALGAAVPDLYEPFAGALRAEGDLAALDGVEQRLLDAQDTAGAIAFARGRAEAAYGLGLLEEGDQWLETGFQRAVEARRYDDLVSLFRASQGVALLVGGRDGLAAARERGRTVAAVGGLPAGLHDRLVPRLALLEGLIAAEDGDFALAQQRLEELRGLDGAARAANLLAAATAALQGRAPPEAREPTDEPIGREGAVTGCIASAAVAAWRDRAGVDPQRAEAEWASIVAEDSPCGQAGLDRLARARAEAAMARLAAARGDAVTAEQHLAAVARWNPEPDLGSPVFQDLADAQERLVWLRQR